MPYLRILTIQKPMAQLKRSKSKVVAGVCAGLADYLGWDVAITRLLYVLLTIFTAFSGVLVYIVLWIAMPEE